EGSIGSRPGRFAQAVEHGDTGHRVRRRPRGRGPLAHDVVEVLDHRKVWIAAARPDLLDAAVAMTERDGDVRRTRRVRALGEHGGLRPDDLERLALRRIERALDRRPEALPPLAP